MDTPTPTGAQAAPQASGEHALLTETLYAELRGIAGRLFASERTGHTLQPTAVVNEACMRIMSSGLPSLPRDQQLAIAGRVLRQVLVDHARKHGALKRGGSGSSAHARIRLEVEQDIAAPQDATVDFDSIHDALERLAELSPRQAEVVTLRLFSGLTMEQIASVTGLSKRSVEGDWTVARAWLRREIGSIGGGV